MRGVVLSLGLYLFFLSRRRRHTRCLSDWSSDVCSSDPARRYPPRPMAFRRPACSLLSWRTPARGQIVHPAPHLAISAVVYVRAMEAKSLFGHQEKEDSRKRKTREKGGSSSTSAHSWSCDAQGSILRALRILSQRGNLDS